MNRQHPYLAIATQFAAVGAIAQTSDTTGMAGTHSFGSDWSESLGSAVFEDDGTVRSRKSTICSYGMGSDLLTSPRIRDMPGRSATAEAVAPGTVGGTTTVAGRRQRSTGTGGDATGDGRTAARDHTGHRPP